MKVKEVLNLYRICRKNVHVYRAEGSIRYTGAPEKKYGYNEEDVSKIIKNEMNRYIAICTCFSSESERWFKYQVDDNFQRRKLTWQGKITT